MIKVVATRYLAGQDYSIRPGNVINEAPFNLPEEVYMDFVAKGQAQVVEVQSVEEETQNEDEFVVLVLDEDGNELMSLHEHEDEEPFEDKVDEEDEVAE